MNISTIQSNSGRQGGFTLIEVMIAICLVAIGLMAVAKFQVSALQADKLAREQSEAAMWAANQAENLLSQSIGSADLDTSVETHGPLLAGENDKYSIEWTVDPATDDPNALIILITVRWDNGGKDKKLDFAYLKTPMM